MTGTLTAQCATALVHTAATSWPGTRVQVGVGDSAPGRRQQRDADRQVWGMSHDLQGARDQEGQLGPAEGRGRSLGLGILGYGDLTGCD